jgi:NitT/TauT family transport system ATP-binding protein
VTSSERGVGVRLEGVGHRYRLGGVTVAALDEVWLGVEPGEFVSIIGPSGCGKTTLLRIIAGFLKPGTGLVNVGDGSPDAARKQRLIGWVPQTPSLCPWETVADNVAQLQAQRDDAVVERLLGEVGLTPFAGVYPRHLSIGMQQRVSLARALAHDPRVLLLDEPFSALDALLRDDMQLLLHRLLRPRTMTAVMVTHSITEAVRLSNRVIVLSPRPGTVQAVISVELPADRSELHESDRDFLSYVEIVREELGVRMVA